MEPDQLIEAAQRYAQRGQYERAAAEYEKVLVRRPQDARVHQRLGELYQRLNNRARAIEHFSRAAAALAAGGFAPKAISLYKQVLAIDPGRADAHMRLAELSAEGGYQREAVEHLQKAAALHARADDAVKLTAVLTRLITLEPERVGHRVKLAELHAREGRVPDAVEVFHQAADVLARTGRVEEHRRVLERLLQLDASDRQALHTAARHDVERGRPERALHRLQALVDADPDDLDALALLARACQESQQAGRALAAYKALAVAMQGAGRATEARAAWEKVRALKPNDRAAADALAPVLPPAPPPLPAPRSIPVPRPPPLPKAAAPAAPERLNADQIERLLREIDVYLQFGLPEQAEANLKRVFASDPQHLGAFEREYQLATVRGDSTKVIEAKLLEVIHRSTRAGDLDRARNRLKDLMRSSPDHPDVPSLRTKLGLPSDAPAEEPLQFADPDLIEEILGEMPAPPVLDDLTDDKAEDEATTPHTILPGFGIDIDPFEEIAAAVRGGSLPFDPQQEIPTAVRSAPSAAKPRHPVASSLSPAKVRAIRAEARAGKHAKELLEPPIAPLPVAAPRRRRTASIPVLHASPQVLKPAARKRVSEVDVPEITVAVDLPPPAPRRRATSSIPMIDVPASKRRLSSVAAPAAPKRRVTASLPAIKKAKPAKVEPSKPERAEKSEKATEPPAMREYVECALVAPSRVAVGGVATVQLVTRPRDEDDAGEAWLPLTAARGDRVRFELGLDGLRAEPRVKQLVWRGREGAVDAAIEVSDEIPVGTVPGWAIVSVGRVPVGRIRFELAVRSGSARDAKVTAQGEAQRFRKAYLAFVEADRARAQACATALKKQGIAIDTEVFGHDVEARWRMRAARRIGDADVLVLLWSDAARRSSALSREWMLALGAKGEGGIVPVRVTAGVAAPAGVDAERFDGGVGYFGDE